MPDVLYWLARGVLVALWLAVAVFAWRRRPAGQRAHAVAIVAIAFASVRALRWNYLLLEDARALLRAAGAYEQRIWFKIALGVVVVSVVVWIARSLRSGSGPALTAAALLMHGTLLAVETCSLDDALPGWLVTQPGRYLFEGTMAVAALVGTVRGAASA